MEFLQNGRSRSSRIQFSCAEKCSPPDSNLFRKLNFENRSTGSKVTNFAGNMGTRAIFKISTHDVTYEPVDRFSKFNFLNRLESGEEHFSSLK